MDRWARPQQQTTNREHGLPHIGGIAGHRVISCVAAYPDERAVDAVSDCFGARRTGVDADTRRSAPTLGAAVIYARVVVVEVVAVYRGQPWRHSPAVAMAWVYARQWWYEATVANAKRQVSNTLSKSVRIENQMSAERTHAGQANLVFSPKHACDNVALSRTRRRDSWSYSVRRVAARVSCLGWARGNTEPHCRRLIVDAHGLIVDINALAGQTSRQREAHSAFSGERTSGSD